MIPLTEASLRQIQEAMEEEHRKDREALARLSRFLPSGSAQRSPVPTPNYAPAEQMVAPPPAPTHDGTIQSAVEVLFFEDSSKTWTTDSIHRELMSRGVRLDAIRPKSTIGVAIRKLLDRHRVITVRHGAGRVPHIYRAVLPDEIREDLPEVDAGGKVVKKRGEL